jgi:hypothetical protein
MHFFYGFNGCTVINGFNGILWDFMGFHGILWDLMGFNGI